MRKNTSIIFQRALPKASSNASNRPNKMYLAHCKSYNAVAQPPCKLALDAAWWIAPPYLAPHYSRVLCIHEHQALCCISLKLHPSPESSSHKTTLYTQHLNFIGVAYSYVVLAERGPLQCHNLRSCHISQHGLEAPTPLHRPLQVPYQSPLIVTTSADVLCRMWCHREGVDRLCVRLQVQEGSAWYTSVHNEYCVRP
jgi:hypothetical protein